MGMRPMRGVKVDGKMAPQLTLLKSVTYAQNVERRYFIIFITMVSRKLCAPKSIQTERSTREDRTIGTMMQTPLNGSADYNGRMRYFVFVIRQWDYASGRWLCYHCRIRGHSLDGRDKQCCQPWLPTEK